MGQNCAPDSARGQNKHLLGQDSARIYGGEGGKADLVSEITSVALYYLKHCTVLQVIKSTDVAIP